MSWAEKKIAVPWENLLVIDRTANVLISLLINVIADCSLEIASTDYINDFDISFQKVSVRVFFNYLIIYVPSTIFQLNRDGSSCVEPVLS